MAIAFKTIADDLLVPGFYTETNDSRAGAGSPVLPRRILVVGQRLTAGISAEGEPFRVFSAADGELHAGAGSQLAEMIHVAKAANPTAEMWAIGMDDVGAGTAATGTITVAGPATASGTIELYAGPYWVGSTLRGRYQIGVLSGATDDDIATDIAAAINADPYRSVDASATNEVVTLTARHKGLLGNSIYVGHSFFQGQRLPTGVGLTIVAMASGATNPDIATAIAAMGDAHTTHLIQPWTDATNLTAVETEMTRRWGGTVQRECHAFSAARGSLGTLTTLGDGRNSELSSICGIGLSPTPPWIAAADFAAVDAMEFHPGRPLKGRRLQSVIAPKAGDEFDLGERQQLLAEGISSVDFDSSGRCFIERIVTTHQEDINGNPTSVFRDRQVPGTLFAIRWDWRSYMGGKYPDFMHAADGTAYAPGLPIVTPTTIKNEFASRARLIWAIDQGWIEDPDQFEADIIVERNEQGMDLVGVPNLINRLHVVRTRFDFLR